MTKDELIKIEIAKHLESVGFSVLTSIKAANVGLAYFNKQVCNSKDAFKESCDHAGDVAHKLQPKVKYKSPKAKSKPRYKKPPEAFNF